MSARKRALGAAEYSEVGSRLVVLTEVADFLPLVLRDEEVVPCVEKVCGTVQRDRGNDHVLVRGSQRQHFGVRAGQPLVHRREVGLGRVGERLDFVVGHVLAVGGLRGVGRGHEEVLKLLHVLLLDADRHEDNLVVLDSVRHWALHLMGIFRDGEALVAGRWEGLVAEQDLDAVVTTDTGDEERGESQAEGRL